MQYQLGQYWNSMKYMIFKHMIQMWTLDNIDIFLS